ncbi:MAG: cytochrome P460 family protein [Pyrinomonadaceae bacterium]
MSNRNKCEMIAVICLALALIACNSDPYAQQQSSKPGSLDSDALHAEISKYKLWTVVNAEPARLDPFQGTLCADVSNAPENPHKDKYIRVYVNDVGQEAMLNAQNPSFPVGTIVIKEKLPEKASQTPEFFTIMVKREAGYDPRGRDWQYLIMGSAKAKIEKPIDIESCQTCHAAWAKKSDLISRAYLSPEQRQKLR